MCRRDDAHVDPDGPGVAERPDLLVLERAQQLHLERGRRVPDLVEQDRAAVCMLEEPALVAVRPGEGALAVAEELALEQRVGQRPAVDRDEEVPAARALLVDRAGHELLAGARLAQDQRREVGGGDLADLIDHLADGAAHAEQRRRGPMVGPCPPAGRTGGKRPVHGVAEHGGSDRSAQHLARRELLEGALDQALRGCLQQQHQRAGCRECGEALQRLEGRLVVLRVEGHHHAGRVQPTRRVERLLRLELAHRTLGGKGGRHAAPEARCSRHDEHDRSALLPPHEAPIDWEGGLP